MKVHQIDGNLPTPPSRPIVLAIGKFDGVHIGHQTILKTARQFQEPGSELGVMCFWPHPSWVLGQKPGYDRSLTPFQDKVNQLQSLGVDHLFHVHFTKAFASTSAEAFVDEVLWNLHVCHVVVGFDFRFGKGGVADVDRLRTLCEARHIPVTVVSPVQENGVKVSSSQIRHHLAEGRVEAAEALLGRPYSMTGIIVHGDKRGRLLGFPTANLGELDDYVMPKSGVYAVSAEILDGQQTIGRQNWFGVMNAGMRPTVQGTEFRVETHLLGFEGDLYGSHLRISLLRRIRDEQKFSSLEELKQQITADAVYARQMLGIPNV